MEQARSLIEFLARLLEFGGVFVILGSVTLASALYAKQVARNKDWRDAYQRYRSNLGRGILLGLELLVGADIISTITSPLTFESVGLLGAIVLIRTFLSFSLEAEIEGCWPWQRREKDRPRTDPAAPR